MTHSRHCPPHQSTARRGPHRPPPTRAGWLLAVLALIAASCSEGGVAELSTKPILSTTSSEAAVVTTATAGSDDAADDGQAAAGSSSVLRLSQPSESAPSTTDDTESSSETGAETTSSSASGSTIAASGSSSTAQTTVAPRSTPPTAAARPSQLPDSFTTLGPGTVLPDGQACADRIRSQPSREAIAGNAGANATVVDVSVDIDGADEYWNSVLAPRIDGNFTGTTEQILRWASCKWGFDEDITRARAVSESSWRVDTKGDVTDDPSQCGRIGLSAPCAQSYGLLQVKGTVHEGTYPATTQSSAFGVDYAMAWLRACYEGSFTWLASAGYVAGDEWGCVGAWFSGDWWDQVANRYVGEVRHHLERQTWNDYG